MNGQGQDAGRAPETRPGGAYPLTWSRNIVEHENKNGMRQLNDAFGRAQAVDPALKKTAWARSQEAQDIRIITRILLYSPLDRSGRAVGHRSANLSSIAIAGKSRDR